MSYASGIAGLVSWDGANVAWPLTAAAECLGGVQRSTEVAGPAGVALAARFAGQQLARRRHILLACDADLRNETELAAEAGLPAGTPLAEVLAALYDRRGPQFVDRLRGAFAVIVWDSSQRQLVAAIDEFGLRRLVFHQDAGRLAVATRIDAALAAAPGAEVRVNPRTIPNLLNFSANLGPETAVVGVERLMPGNLLVARGPGHLERRQYWDLRYGGGARRSESEWARAVECAVEEAVAADLRGGRLGAFLSGGTDSSTVVGMMSRRSADPVQAFSIGFAEQTFNELEYARLAARHFHAAHHTYEISPSDCFDALPRLVRAFDEPFGNSSAVGTYFCARLAKQQGVDVLLAGDGGDELFGGNEHYRIDQIFQNYYHLPGWLRRGVVEPLLRLPVSAGPFAKARRYVRRATLPVGERLVSFQFLGGEQDAGTHIFSDGLQQALQGYRVATRPSEHYAAARAADHVDRMLYLDMKITLADNDLPKVTCSTELAGVQPRFPYLSRELASLTASMPARYKLRRLEKRYLFKRAFANLLPAEILRKKKHGFGVPVADWLKTDPRLRELTRDTLASRAFRERGYFRPEFTQQLFEAHASDATSYTGDVLWTVLALELWHHEYVDAVRARAHA
ncbi:MAG: hypothetical protein IT162_04165 [Bryobacterales bacterium]|nr:hypothetical protein [Bryobacterales bacterium]